VQRIYEYWRDSTNLESHFGLAFDGDLGQFIGTQTRADANMYANVRAISLESASNLDHTDPWTDKQIQAIIGLGVWLNRTHGIPAKVPDAWDKPGMGFHSMFPQWSDGGTACPGDARRQQFHNQILPGIQAALSGASTPPPTNGVHMAKPADTIVIKGNPNQGNGNEVFVIFASGMIRLLTEAEFTAWGGTVCIDQQIKPGDDATFNLFMSFDKALHA
jgi:hypothetical protein